MISLNGIAVPHQTLAVRQWVEKFIPVSEVIPFDPGMGRQNMNHLMLPPEMPVPPIRIGVLHWPSHASRFATFHTLLTENQLAEVDPDYPGLASTHYDSADGYYDTAGNQRDWTLVIDEGNAGRLITTVMHPLTPMPLQEIGSLEKLYLVTLVDDRYFWWRKTGRVEIVLSGIPPSEGETTWEDVFSQISSIIGTSFTQDAIDPAFACPPRLLDSSDLPAGLLLDAAAAGVGQGVVRLLDGTVQVESPATALTAYDAAVAAYAGDKLAGGQGKQSHLVWDVPEQIEVNYARLANNIWIQGQYPVAVDLNELGISQFSSVGGRPGALAVFAGLIARWNNYTGNGDPLNRTQLHNHAKALATAIYKWGLRKPDFHYAGVVPFTPNGFVDAIEWHHHAEGEQHHKSYNPGGHRVTTRVLPPPWNWREVGRPWISRETGWGGTTPDQGVRARDDETDWDAAVGPRQRFHFLSSDVGNVTVEDDTENDEIKVWIGGKGVRRNARQVQVIGPAVGLRYPARVRKQIGTPPEWPGEEDCWLWGSNGETLELNRNYIATPPALGDALVDGKRTWATFCCDGGYPDAGPDQPTNGPGCCDDPPDDFFVKVQDQGDVFHTDLLCLTITVVEGSGQSETTSTSGTEWSGETTYTVDDCTFTYSAKLQCISCKSPPPDAECHPDCSDEDAFYYCYSWRLVGFCDGQCIEDKSGTVLFPGEGLYCDDITLTSDDGNTIISETLADDDCPANACEMGQEETWHADVGVDFQVPRFIYARIRWCLFPFSDPLTCHDCYQIPDTLIVFAWDSVDQRWESAPFSTSGQGGCTFNSLGITVTPIYSAGGGGPVRMDVASVWSITENIDCHTITGLTTTNSTVTVSGTDRTPFLCPCVRLPKATFDFGPVSECNYQVEIFC